MRPLTIVGLVLIVAGLFVGFRGVNYRSDRSVLRVGEFEASVEERRAVPAWAGWAGAVVGLVLVGAGLRSRRDA